MFSRITICLIIILLTTQFTHAGPSRIENVRINSPALGIEKNFEIYLPEGYDESEERYPTIYLFRGRETEWRFYGNIKFLTDREIGLNNMGKMILVMPGLTFQGEGIVGVPVNMKARDLLGEKSGVGTGQFEDYLIQDLIPHVDENYRTLANRAARGVDGFSTGGYVAIMIAVKHPELFSSAGAYDGFHFWTDFNDPAISGDMDDVIANTSNFDPFFDLPRDIDYMKQYNSANIIVLAEQDQIDTLKTIQFLIHSASENARQAWNEGTYYPRTQHLVELMAQKGISNYFGGDTRLAENAEHSWSWVKDHIIITLPLHWKKFQLSTSVKSAKVEVLPDEFTLFQNYPNPFNPETTIQYQVPKRSEVKLVIFSLIGQRVVTLVDKVQSMGVYSVQWDGKDDAGKKVASGVYLYRLQTDQFVQVKKLALLR